MSDSTVPRLAGRAAIVTGAGRGLGRAFATALAAEGARVAVNDIDRDEAEKVAAEIRGSGGAAFASSDDVGDWRAAKHLVTECARSFGGLDILVNNAGLTRAVPIWAEDEAGFDTLVRANLKGTFAMTRHAAELMRAARRGSIINLTSGAQAGVAPRSVYAATKGGVASLTYTWAMELAEFGVRVNAVSPAAYTRMSPVVLPAGEEPPPDRRPENIAPLVVYLASEASRGITGQVFRLMGRSLALFHHPRPSDFLRDERGWTLEVLDERLLRDLGPRFDPVGVEAKVYRGPATQSPDRQ